ncbi:type IV secretory system conjugative DNA transfer family protein [Luteimicrobium sp. DT211]|uniref:type IV secretory system conjugative DNA transfer family protein n=1 Tax=Luteimicrobium sp. DT211 TaxID=3393412 RepID=UPI003CEAA516
MTPAPRRPRSLGDSAVTLAIAVVGLVAALIGLLHLAALTVAALTGHSAPTFHDTLDAVRARPTNPVGGYVTSPGPAPVIYALVVVVALALIVGAVWAGMTIAGWMTDRRYNRTTLRDLAPMTLSAAQEAADKVVPAAAAQELAPVDRVVAVCTYRGKPLFAQHEDSFLVIGPPRSGKTSRLVIDWILDAPGAVVITGTKSDVVYYTHTPRAEKGVVSVFDHGGSITGWPTTLKWDPVAGCEDPDEARERGRSWAAADPERLSGKNAWFTNQAGEILAFFLHAAALKPGGSMRDVMRWASDFSSNEPAMVLRSQGAIVDPVTGEAVGAPVVSRGTELWADLLKARTQSQAKETAASLGTTLVGLLAALTSPAVLEALCPAPGEGFDIDEFLTGPNTLYLMSGEGVGSVAPLVTTLAGAVVRRAKDKSQETGRLWPPLALILDEAANVAPLPDLPGLMSDSGGRGISVRVICQSKAQMVQRWSDAGANAIIAAATTQMYLPGIKDPEHLRALSEMHGRYRAHRLSASSGHSGGSTTTSSEWENRLAGDEIRRLKLGEALMFYRELKSAQVTLTPWWDGKSKDAVEKSAKAAEQLTGRKIDG